MIVISPVQMCGKIPIIPFIAGKLCVIGLKDIKQEIEDNKTIGEIDLSLA